MQRSLSGHTGEVKAPYVLADGTLAGVSCDIQTTKWSPKHFQRLTRGSGNIIQQDYIENILIWFFKVNHIGLRKKEKSFEIYDTKGQWFYPPGEQLNIIK